MATFPIWKDYFVDLGAGDSAQYRIILDDTASVVYSGKAFRRPGDESISVRINDICADFFANVLPELIQATFTEMAMPLSFTIQVLQGDTWVDVDSVKFNNDWSYDYGHTPEMGVAFPITGDVDVRMPITWTGVGISQVVATIFFKDGTTRQERIPLGVAPGDFNDDFSDDFFASATKSGTAVFLPSTWNNVDRIVIGNVTYRVVSNCDKYALYYVNAYGGWDMFLISGNDLETDTIKRFTRAVEYDNRDIRNRGIDNFVNEITKSFTLHTGWLSDEQASRMHHLINSTDVYLYDISQGVMIPVTLPGTTCEYKTFSNQGNQMVNYTIQVDVAQDRIRR